MTRSELLAILKFLENSRSIGLTKLGTNAPDPVWMMTIALLRRHYSNQRITISSLAETSGTSYTTSLRQIDRMIDEGLLRRVRDPAQPKLVYIEPTEELLFNFQAYCIDLKTHIGSAFGLGKTEEHSFVFGGAYLAARILGPPRKLNPPLRLDGPLRLLLKDEPTFLTLERMTAEISTCLNTDVKIDILDYEALNQAVIDNSREECSAYDIIALDAPWLGRMSLENALLPLDEFLQHSSLNPFDFYAAAWELGRCMGRQLGVPIAPTAELLLYRKDIFDENGLVPPETTGQVIAAARTLHRPHDGRYGIAWNAARGQALGQTFLQVMAAFGSPPVNLRKYGVGFDNDTPWEELKPTLDNAAGCMTLDYLEELAAFSPPDISTMDWNRRMESYRCGETVMCYAWSTHTSQIENDPTSMARERTGYLLHPGRTRGSGVSTMGGFVLAIPSNIQPARRRSAWRALEWAVRPEVSKSLIQNGSPAKFMHSVAADPEVRDTLPAMEAMASMERRGQLQTWPRPPIPFMASIMRIIGQEIHDVIWSDAGKHGVLKRAENRIKPLFDSLRDYPNDPKGKRQVHLLADE
ncbi:extracellular solute-binding protein [Rhizobium binxianense]